MSEKKEDREDAKSQNDSAPAGDKEDGVLMAAIRTSRTKFVSVVVLSSLVAFVVIMLIFFSARARVVSSVPDIEKLWIVSRIEGEGIATDEAKTVRDGRGVMLYLVAYGYDRTVDDYFYYMDVVGDEFPRVIIDGKEVAPEKIRSFEFFDTESVVQWFKIEITPRFLRGRNKRIYWTESQIHLMGNRWWAIADVRADLEKFYHSDYSGTMRFMARLQFYNVNDPRNPVKIDTEGSEPAASGEIPPGALRITMTAAHRPALDGAYRAYFNLVALQDKPEGVPPLEPAREFRGGDSRAILVSSLIDLGYDVDYDNPDFLSGVADLVFGEVFLDQEYDFQGAHLFRDRSNIDEPIPLMGYDEDCGGSPCIKQGDILVQGDRYLVVVCDIEYYPPPAGNFSDDDQVLDAYNDFVRPTEANVLSKSEAPIQVWRLRPLPTAEAVGGGR